MEIYDKYDESAITVEMMPHGARARERARKNENGPFIKFCSEECSLEKRPQALEARTGMVVFWLALGVSAYVIAPRTAPEATEGCTSRGGSSLRQAIQSVGPARTDARAREGGVSPDQAS